MLSLIFTIVNVKTLNKNILIIKKTWQSVKLNSLRSSAKSYDAAAAAASIIESAETDSFEI